MHIHSVFLSLLAAIAVNATLNEPCYGSGGAPGVCVTTASCSSSGGTTINGACPSDPANVKCCTKPTCSTNASGNCRWSSDCKGTSLPANLCPGPARFQCCLSKDNGFGGYLAPNFPAVGACKAGAVEGAKKIVAAFPERIREIGCARACACPGNSDHCCGKATDMMCSDGGGIPTTSGKEIAEWVMHHSGPLHVKYVIWGQRIWQPSVDSVKPWTSWKPMEDRGDVTQNHWDHVHVSYN